MTKFCYKCERILPYISEEVFFSEEAKDGLETMVRGIRFTSNPFLVDVYGDSTENWICNRCWWIDWWEI